jgi:signal transduction histidine kinase
MALEESSPGTPIYEDLQEIHASAQRSADLTRQLLAFARKQAIRPQVLDLDELVEGMLKMLQRLTGEGIRFVWRPGKSVWPICIDPSQVDQILVNLVVNARDAIGDIGTVTIATENATLDDDYCRTHSDCTPGYYVCLSVSDTGVGMSKEVMARIFEPFFTTKEVGQGTRTGVVHGLWRRAAERRFDRRLQRARPRTHLPHLPTRASTASALADTKPICSGRRP